MAGKVSSLIRTDRDNSGIVVDGIVVEMSLVIRPIEAKDKPQWVELWSNPESSYLKFYKSLDKVSAEVTEFTFGRFLDPKVPMYAIVAEVDGELIGFAHYLTHLNTWAKDELLYLNDLFVSEKNRLSGVGRQLIEYVYKEADRLGCGTTYWKTQFENHRAQMLYCKVGKKQGFLTYCRP